MSDIPTSESLGPCPACGGAFESVHVGPYVIDRCGTCRGLWLNEHELEKILAIDHRMLTKKRGDTDPGLARSKKGKCPRCNGTLIKLANMRANITTDSCTICYGIFLDAGELNAFDHPNLAGQVGQLLRKLIGRH
jgi:Zn-finger nucleic acid-binding protein